MLPPLPIDAVLPELLAALRVNSAVVLRAPTGAGKTTRVPPALLDAKLAGQKPTDAQQVIVLEPRRLAARAAASRMATERNVALGDEVGYQVRFENRASAHTRLLVCTEGVLLRRLQDDPFLSGVAAVVFDEFHERSLNSDVALALCRRVQAEVRPDLKLIVMSATLAAEPVARYLDNCPIVESQGRLHPVAVHYQRHETRDALPVAAARGVGEILEQTTGDVLVFLPGVGEIRRTASELQGLAERQGLALVQLYGDLPLDEQQRALRPLAQRKVVLATNVAETSVTIEGVTGVVDTGVARVMRLDPALGLNRLEMERISRASADQRTGRAGRTAPGVCLRLWTERQQQGLAEFDTPEVRRVDLAGPALELMCWGERDVAAFPWYEAPPTAALEQALTLLRRLGATDAAGVTKLGRAMARLPVHPRLARLLVEGHRLGCAERVALAAALLAERDPFLRSERRTATHRSTSDLLDRVQALEDFEQSSQRQTDVGALDTQSARFILRAAEQLLRELRQELGREPPLRLEPDEAFERAVFAAFADRLARRREAGSRRALMVGGRGIRLDERSAVTEAELFVAVELAEQGGSEALARLASAVDRAWLPRELYSTRVVARFDPLRESLFAYKQSYYEDLLLDEAPVPVSDAPEANEVLVEAVRPHFERFLAADEAASQFVARINSLRLWMPELKIEEIDQQWLETWVLWEWCSGKKSFAELKRAPLLPVIRGAISDSEHLYYVESEAPERIEVPSGSRIALHYEAGKPPVLAVRIQEIFGLWETPRVASGRIPVLLHLLAPNMRVEQVTNDLASFWRRTYGTVRKELKRRYPKHAWPEDPYTAKAEHKPGRKK